MKDDRRTELQSGIELLVAFAVWTVLIQCIDVQDVGVNGTKIGFATINVWFHRMTGVHMMIYTITDWLGLIPIITCLCFGIVGFIQLINRKSLLKVDPDILLLGIYYVLVILGYLLFEMVPINYRPILIDGNLEASYPSSTTLLVLSVMPTLKYQVDRRFASTKIRKAATVFVIAFTLLMVIGRLISGVHWATDIVGSILLSAGLYMIYRSMVLYIGQKKTGLKAEASDGVQ